MNTPAKGSLPTRFVRYVTVALRAPRVELTRHQRRLRNAWDLVAHCWRVLQRHRAEGMAAELTYRTIFSLIPLVVLGLVTFRIFGGLDKIETQVEDQVYSFFGVPEVPEVAYEDVRDDAEGGLGPVDAGEADGAITELEPDVRPDPELNPSGVPAEDSAPEAPKPSTSLIPGASPIPVSGSGGAAASVLAPDAPNPTINSAAEKRQVQASIRWALRELTAKVANLDFASIGIFGLLLFIYAAIALADSVESVFNLIYEAPVERPIHLRIAIHWSIITLGSGLLAMSLYVSGQLAEYATSATGWQITLYVNHLLAWLSGWVLLFLLYALMPNTHVSVRAAAVGAVVAATLWEIAKYGFQAYVSNAVPYSALYGSLGLIPLFLFWVYVTWFIFLFGLVWTYTLQTAPGRVPTKEDDDVADDMLYADPEWLLPLVIEVAQAFDRGETVLRDQLQKRLGLPTRVLQPMVELLSHAGILRRLETDQGEQLVLGRPAEKINAAEIVRLGRYVPTPGRSAGWKVLGTLRRAEDEVLDTRTLAELVQET